MNINYITTVTVPDVYPELDMNELINLRTNLINSSISDDHLDPHLTNVNCIIVNRAYYSDERASLEVEGVIEDIIRVLERVEELIIRYHNPRKDLGTYDEQVMRSEAVERDLEVIRSRDKNADYHPRRPLGAFYPGHGNHEYDQGPEIDRKKVANPCIFDSNGNSIHAPLFPYNDALSIKYAMDKLLEHTVTEGEAMELIQPLKEGKVDRLKIGTGYAILGSYDNPPHTIEVGTHIVKCLDHEMRGCPDRSYNVSKNKVLLLSEVQPKKEEELKYHESCVQCSSKQRSTLNNFKQYVVWWYLSKQQIVITVDDVTKSMYDEYVCNHGDEMCLPKFTLVPGPTGNTSVMPALGTGKLMKTKVKVTGKDGCKAEGNSIFDIMRRDFLFLNDYIVNSPESRNQYIRGCTSIEITYS